jgi:hypothetical protein
LGKVEKTERERRNETRAVKLKERKISLLIIEVLQKQKRNRDIYTT